MYQSIIKTPDESLCHLFLHCCMKDGKLNDAELDIAAEKIVRLGLHKNVDIKLETTRYREYRQSISDQSEYINFLISEISPVNNLAIYSYCVEMVMSDEEINISEDRLLKTIGESLQLTGEEQIIIQKLVAQKKVVEGEGLF